MMNFAVLSSWWRTICFFSIEEKRAPLHYDVVTTLFDLHIPHEADTNARVAKQPTNLTDYLDRYPI